MELLGQESTCHATFLIYYLAFLCGCCYSVISISISTLHQQKFNKYVYYKAWEKKKIRYELVVLCKKIVTHLLLLVKKKYIDFLLKIPKDNYDFSVT